MYSNCNLTFGRPYATQDSLSCQSVFVGPKRKRLFAVMDIKCKFFMPNLSAY